MSGPSLRVSEVFASIQGEGPSVGTPSMFVRLQGCTVGCTWCDTRYAWDPGGGEELALAELLDRVKVTGLHNVVVTGGEPLEHPALAPLVSGLRAMGRRIEVETAGVVTPPPLAVDQWNVSLKLAHSGVPRDRRLIPAAIDRFRDLGAWFKFVVGEERDVDEVLEIQARHALPSQRIVLMPLGLQCEEQRALMPLTIEWCKRHDFRFSPRLHILLWGPRRGV